MTTSNPAITNDYTTPAPTAAPAPSPAPTAAPSVASPAMSTSAPVQNFGNSAANITSPLVSNYKDDGFKYVNSNGQQVLGMTQTELEGLTEGAASMSGATGKTLSAYDYDKQLNPATYAARWNADGTPKFNSDGTQLAPGAVSTTPAPTATPAPAPSTGIISSARDGKYTPWNVTPEQTVQDRIASILNPNNPIIQQARAQANDQMNSRGLVNSAMAGTAADAAAYQAAIPIATADAATFSKAAGYNSDIQNQMSMQGRQLDSQQSIAQLQSDTQKYGYDSSAATQRYTADSSAATQKFVANLNSDTQKTIDGMDNASKLQISQLQNTNQLQITGTQQGATIFNQAVAAISTIQNNDKMDATSKTTAIAQILNTAQNELKGIRTSTGAQVNLNLNNLPGFDANGNYVGFDASGNTKDPSAPPPAPAPSPTSNPFTDIVLTQ